MSTNTFVRPRCQRWSCWGANDEIFAPAGAKAFNQDLPHAQVHLLDTGHFALESHLDTVSDHIRHFLAQVPC